MDISELAKELGKLGGNKTKERLAKDPDYYKKIGRAGGRAGKGKHKNKQVIVSDKPTRGKIAQYPF